MQDLDSLLRRASSQYLQGNVEEALEAWQAVLRVAPDHERAIEGVRVCRQMLASRTGEVETGADAGEPGDAFADIDEKLEFGEAATSDVDLAWSLSEDSDGGEVDLPPATDTARAAEDPVARQAAAPGWSWSDGDEPAPEPLHADVEPAAALPPPTSTVPAASAPTATTSEMELRRRANELLANALVAMEAGNDDEARRTLDRVLILDETNVAARDLKEKIAAAQRSRPATAASPPRPAVDLEPPAEAAPTIELAAIDLDPGIARPEPRLPATELPAEDPLAPEDGFDAQPPEAGARAKAKASMPGAEDAPGRRGAIATVLEPGFRRWMAIASVLAVCAAAFYVFLGGNEAEEAEPEPPAAVDASAGGSKPRRTQPAVAETPDAAPAGRAAGADVDVAAGLARAREAVAAGGYSDAVLAYSAVLKVEPNNAEARAGLKQAGDAYRKQQEAEQQWEQALQAFREENFAEALRQFYRMDRPQDAELIRRYKVDGWYNLGVLALRAGDCTQAQANFQDAREAQGSDAGLAEALGLARSCAKDEQFLGQVAALSLRSPAG